TSDPMPTAAKLQAGLVRSLALGKRAHPGRARESLRPHARAPDKSHSRSCAYRWKETPQSQGLQGAPRVSARLPVSGAMPAPNAAPTSAGTTWRARPRPYLQSSEQSSEQGQADRPGTAGTARARRIAGGIASVADLRPSRPTRPAVSVRQAPAEPAADRDPRPSAIANPKALVGGVPPPRPATLPGAGPESVTRPSAGESLSSKSRPIFPPKFPPKPPPKSLPRLPPRAASPMRFRRRTGSGQK